MTKEGSLSGPPLCGTVISNALGAFLTSVNSTAVRARRWISGSTQTANVMASSQYVKKTYAHMEDASFPPGATAGNTSPQNEVRIPALAASRWSGIAITCFHFRCLTIVGYAAGSLRPIPPCRPSPSSPRPPESIKNQKSWNTSGHGMRSPLAQRVTPSKV